MQILKYAAIGVLVVVVCGAGLLYWLYRSIEASTEVNHDEPKIMLSPNGSYQALVFEAVRGGNPRSASYSTWVAILPAGQKLEKHGTGNVMGYSHEREEHPAISVQWLNNSQLLVRAPDKDNTHIYYSRDNVDGIHVTYEINW